MSLRIIRGSTHPEYKGHAFEIHDGDTFIAYCVTRKALEWAWAELTQSITALESTRVERATKGEHFNSELYSQIVRVQRQIG